MYDSLVINDFCKDSQIKYIYGTAGLPTGIGCSMILFKIEIKDKVRDEEIKRGTIEVADVEPLGIKRDTSVVWFDGEAEADVEMK